MERGYIQVYYGDGKGKTTAAVGQAVRAAGAGMSVCFAQFLKSGASCELEGLRSLGIRMISGAQCKFAFQMTEEEKAEARRRNEAILDEALILEDDMLVLDEAMDACRLGLLDRNRVLALLRERSDKTGIVYCATRAAVEKVCQTLCDNGFSATRYHAGLADEERRANQEDFQFDRKQIMVATNAFGMGIDKSNVGFVIHYQMPKSLESYYQEAGRAGRDGAAADCILLFSPGDIETAKFFIANSSAEEQSEEAQQAFQAREYARLRVMVDYCRRTDCLRGAILDYFGQAHEATCGSCGNCKSSYRSEDITVEAQMILSCVLRVKEKIGYFVGKTLIARILTGSRDKKILSQHLDELSTYGLMRTSSLGKVREIMDFLESQGYLRVNPAHSTLEITGQASAVLRGAQQVFMPVRVESRKEPKKQAPGKRPAAAAPEAEGLYAALKAVRYQIAQEEKVPAYIIFSNATLLDMAAREPRTMAEFLEASGVGEVKAARYGKTFLAAIAAFFDD